MLDSALLVASELATNAVRLPAVISLSRSASVPRSLFRRHRCRHVGRLMPSTAAIANESTPSGNTNANNFNNTMLVLSRPSSTRRHHTRFGIYPPPTRT
jgi:hypothetical protein